MAREKSKPVRAKPKATLDAARAARLRALINTPRKAAADRFLLTAGAPTADAESRDVVASIARLACASVVHAAKQVMAVSKRRTMTSAHARHAMSLMDMQFAGEYKSRPRKTRGRGPKPAAVDKTT